MTSDSGAVPAEEIESASSALERAVGPNSAKVAGAYFRVAALFLVVGVLDYLVLAVKRVAPEFLGGISYLSYGHLAPAAAHFVLTGWLTIGLLGALIYIVPRVTGQPLADTRQARFGLLLMAGGTLAGALGILFGFSDGRLYLEAPLPADAVVLIGMLLAVRTIWLNAKTLTESNPVVLYAVAGGVSLVLVHFTGNVPGITGYAIALQSAFYRSALFGLFAVVAAVAVVYFLIPRLAGRGALPTTKLSVIGLWSLGLCWVMAAPASLTFGAAPDWLETVGVMFSICLFVPILVIGTDLVHGLRGTWGNIVDKVAMRFVLGGLAMVGVLAVMILVQALRSSSAVVGLTDWVAAVETMALFGPFTFILLALIRYAAPDFTGGGAVRSGRPYLIAVLGLTLTVGAMVVAGVQTGFTWAGSANTAEYSNTGVGFISTVLPLAGLYWLQVVGLAILGIGLVAAVATSFFGSAQVVEPQEIAIEDDPALSVAGPSLSQVRRYSLGVFAVALLFLLVAPAQDSPRPTLFSDQRTFESLPLLGRSIYIREGCMYCHTQQVRPIITDVGLGPVSVLGDYASERPLLVGVQRYGPDLTHFADRAGDLGESNSLIRHLRAPAESRPWTIMPSYDYLNVDEVAAIAAYLLGK